jgi:hypothetical protein
MTMANMMKFGAVLAFLLTSAGAYADDPTGVLQQERQANQPMAHKHHKAMKSGRAAFSDSGPCQRGMQSEPFPNAQGYRCVRR